MADLSPPDGLLDALSEKFGELVSSGESIRNLHSHDEGGHMAAMPYAVLFPKSSSDVSQMVAMCSEYDVPVIPFGVGSGQEGGVNAVRGGVSIDTSGLNKIIKINQEDMDCEVEAGVTRLQLADALRDTGLMFPVDPGADASFGGMAATRAAGTTTPRYGGMRENVMGLEVVLANGETIQTGSRARKSSSGYDLTHLFVGSEGTLGLITKIRLKLHPAPEAILAMSAVFDNFQDAVATVVDITRYGLPIARVEMMDALQIQAVNLYLDLDMPEKPSLFFEFHGAEESLTSIAEIAQAVCHENSVIDVIHASRTEEQTKIWKARHSAAHAEAMLRPGARAIVTDVGVPVTALPDILMAAQAKIEELKLIAPMTGHMADGNFHFAVLVDDDNQDELDRADTFKEWLAEYALSLDGTVSGEHGIGMGKTSLMQREHGPALDVMRAIKVALDPKNIFNPGKVLP